VEYLTALEIANKWNISSRMVAYYCENGRINGAVKKGKTWIIPVNSEKPVDKRYSKKKINIKENSELQGERQNINKTDIENITAIYRTSDIYKNLGLTREILRYYEEIGLINPKRNQDNQYRGKCLYTTIAADNDDNSIMDKMFSLAYKWAAEHKEAFRGVVYIFIRFIMLNDHKRNEFI
jgi:hypothetical protein